MLYAAIPFGYFSESIGDDMLNKTPPVEDEANTGVPRIGRVCYNDIGGIMGNWFLEAQRIRVELAQGWNSAAEFSAYAKYYIR